MIKKNYDFSELYNTQAQIKGHFRELEKQVDQFGQKRQKNSQEHYKKIIKTKASFRTRNWVSQPKTQGSLEEKTPHLQIGLNSANLMMDQEKKMQEMILQEESSRRMFDDVKRHQVDRDPGQGTIYKEVVDKQKIIKKVKGLFKAKRIELGSNQNEHDKQKAEAQMIARSLCAQRVFDEDKCLLEKNQGYNAGYDFPNSSPLIDKYHHQQSRFHYLDTITNP